MKKCMVLICLCLMSIALNSSAAEKVIINSNWNFALGKDTNKMPEYVKWTEVSLPHDWTIDLPFSRDYDRNTINRNIGWEHTSNSIAWYRKALDIPYSYSGKRVSLVLEAVHTESKVYCNGKYVGGDYSGKHNLIFDITECLEPGGDNMLEVQVRALESDAAGITGNAYLLVQSDVYFKPEYLTISSSSDKANVKAVVSSKSFDSDETVAVMFSLMDAEGNTLETSSASTATIETYQEIAFTHSFSLAGAKLWSPGNPYLYTIKAELYSGSELLDVQESTFAFKDYSYSSQDGMIINGNKVQLKAVKIEQKHAGVGRAVPDKLWEYKLGKLMEMGCNTIYVKDGPASRALLEYCDRMGLMLIEYVDVSSLNSDLFALTQQTIRHGMNHPSLLFWDFVNENTRSQLERLALKEDNFRSSMTQINGFQCLDEEDLYNSVGDYSELGHQMRAMWTSTPYLAVTPGWNFDVKAGQNVEITIYSNCDEVRLNVNGKNMGRKAVPVDGKQVWTVPYRSGRITATAYNKRRKAVEKTVNTVQAAFQIIVNPSKPSLLPDGEDIMVLDVVMHDYYERPTGLTDMNLNLYVDKDLVSAYGMVDVPNQDEIKFAPVEILGMTNANPMDADKSRPQKGAKEATFSTYKGRAQVILRSVKGSKGQIHLRVGGSQMHSSSFLLDYKQID